MSDLLRAIQRLIETLGNLPETMSNLREQGERIAAYAQYAVVIAFILGIVYVFRGLLGGVLDYFFKWKPMRNIDDRESQAAEAQAVVRVAQALKGQGQAVTADDLLKAVETYHQLTQRVHEKRGQKFPKEKK